MEAAEHFAVEAQGPERIEEALDAHLKATGVAGVARGRDDGHVDAADHQRDDLPNHGVVLLDVLSIRVQRPVRVKGHETDGRGDAVHLQRWRMHVRSQPIERRQEDVPLRNACAGRT